jgi:glycosyltransferase 2 family protein
MLVVGLAVVAGTSIYGNVHAIADRLAGFEWWAFAAALALALANYAGRFARWTLYLRAAAIHVPAGRSALVFVSGFALSITPGKIGELIKSYLLRETDGVPVTASAPIVVAERLTDLLALVLLSLAGVAAYGISPHAVLGGAVVVSVGIGILAWPRLGHASIKIVCAPRRLRPLGTRLREFYDHLGALIRPSRLAWSSGLAVLAWLAECAGFALIVSAFPGAQVSLGLATLIYASTTIAGALSILPGGLVVTEATMTLFLVRSAHGIDEAGAAAATILTRLATLWFAVGLGVIALAVLRRHRPGALAALTPTPSTAGASSAPAQPRPHPSDEPPRR